MPPDALREAARRMREAYEAVSPFIEEHTAAACPSCARVCCIDRHGTHEEEDLAFLRALGETPPPEPPRADDTLPCRHLGRTGCVLPRFRRPFRCTWYFCRALIESMPQGSPRRYRAFLARFAELQEARLRVIGLAPGEAAKEPIP